MATLSGPKRGIYFDAGNGSIHMRKNIWKCGMPWTCAGPSMPIVASKLEMLGAIDRPWIKRNSWAEAERLDVRSIRRNTIPAFPRQAAPFCSCLVTTACAETCRFPTSGFLTSCSPSNWRGPQFFASRWLPQRAKT